MIAAALKIQARHGDDALMLVLASDHLIRDVDAFKEAVGRAAALAARAPAVRRRGCCSTRCVPCLNWCGRRCC